MLMNIPENDSRKLAIAKIDEKFGISKTFSGPLPAANETSRAVLANGSDWGRRHASQGRADRRQNVAQSFEVRFYVHECYL